MRSNRTGRIRIFPLPNPPMIRITRLPIFLLATRLAKKRDALSAEGLATYLVHPGQSIQAGWSRLAEGNFDTPMQSTRRGGIAKVSYLRRI